MAIAGDLAALLAGGGGALPSLHIAGLGWQEVGEAALEGAAGRLLGIAEVQELSVPQPVDGEEMRAVFPVLGLADQDHHLAVKGF